MATQAQIAQQMISQLKVLDPSVSAAVGTPERMIIETVAQALAEAQVDLNVLQGSLDVDAKVGTDLDNFLALFGFGRQQGARSTGYAVFSRNEAAPADITIRRGTQLRAAGASVDGHDVIFYTTMAGTILQNTTEVIIPIECALPGELGNVAANTITESYQTTIPGVTEITNDYATAGGVDVETDEQVKARFKATGPFRNLSGTESQYLATAISTKAKKAIVVGPVSKQREYFQIPLKPDNDGTGNSAIVNQYTTALSANNNAKYVYDDNYYVINESTTPATHYKKDFDFIFNSDIGITTSKNKGDAYREFQNGVPGALDPTSEDANGKPNFTFTNVWQLDTVTNKPVTALAPGDVVLTEHSYLSTASRNDYESGIMNCVDVYVNNNDYQPASTTIPRPGLGIPTFLFTGDRDDAFYIENFRRLDEPEHRPVVGNAFTPLYKQPSADVPLQIEISDTTYYKNVHYWPVEDITSIGKTVRARNGIEWSSTIKGQKTELDEDIGPYTGQYAIAGNIFDNLINVKGKISKTGAETAGVSAFVEGQNTFDVLITETGGIEELVEGMYISGSGLGSETIVTQIGTPSSVQWSGYFNNVTKYPITIGISPDAPKTGWCAVVTSAQASGATYTYTCSAAHGFKVGSKVRITGATISDYNIDGASIISISEDGKSFSANGLTSFDNPNVTAFTNGFAVIVTHSVGDYVTFDASSNSTALIKTYYCKTDITTSTSTKAAPPAYKITSITTSGTSPNITYTFTVQPRTGSSTQLANGQTVIVSGTTGGNFDKTYTIVYNSGNTFTVTGQSIAPANQTNLTTAVAIDSRNWVDGSKTIASGDVSEIYSFGYPVNKNDGSIYLSNNYDWPVSGVVQIDKEYIGYSSATETTIGEGSEENAVILSGLSRGQVGTVNSNHVIGSAVSLYNSSTDTYFNIDNYIYDRNVEILQGALEGVKQITTDVLAHQASVRYFKPDITVMLDPGMSTDVVKSNIRSTLTTHFSDQYFGNIVQLSDILQVIHNTSGVDNVKWSRDAIRPWVANKSYAANSYVIDNEIVYYSQHGVSTTSAKSTPPSAAAAMSYSIASATASGVNYTYTLSTVHDLEIGDWINVAGSNVVEYNGDFQITTIGNTTVTVQGETASPATPDFDESGLVTNINWAVDDPRNRLTETNSKGDPIVQAILDRVQVGGDGVRKTAYNFYFAGSDENGDVPIGGKIKILISKILSDGDTDSKYTEIDVGSAAFKTSAVAACAYIKAKINSVSPDLVESVIAPSDVAIPDSLNQFVITFSDSNRTEVLTASNVSLVGNFGSYNYDFDLRDNELISLPRGEFDSEGALEIDSVMNVRIRSQSTWNVE